MRKVLKMKSTRDLVYFLLALIALILVGYIGYSFGFLGFIYNVMMPNLFSNYNLVVLSVIFGIAAFFSPCAFTVLPAYVSHFLAGEENQTNKALRLGVIAALGIITVNLVIGIIIGLLGAATPFAKDPRQDIPIILGIRALAGAIIAILGFLTLIGRPVNLHFVHDFLSKQSFAKSIYFYGVMYNAAAIGCTGPILLGLMLYAYASGSFAFAFTSFLIFSLTMGTLMFLLTLLSALLKQKLVDKLAKITPAIKTVASLVMMAAGLAIFLLTLEGNNLFVQLFFPYLK